MDLDIRLMSYGLKVTCDEDYPSVPPTVGLVLLTKPDAWLTQRSPVLFAGSHSTDSTTHVKSR